MRRRQPMRSTGNGWRGRRGRRLRLRYARLWLAAGEARATIGADPNTMASGQPSATRPVPRTALSPGAQRALAMIFPPATADGTCPTTAEDAATLPRVAEERAHYGTKRSGTNAHGDKALDELGNK